MSFDPKSLLTPPLPPDLTIDGLIVELERLADLGFGSAKFKLQDGDTPNAVELVAQGLEPAHFRLRRIKAPK